MAPRSSVDQSGAGIDREKVIGGHHLQPDGPFETIKLLYYCGLAGAG